MRPVFQAAAAASVLLVLLIGPASAVDQQLVKVSLLDMTAMFGPGSGPGAGYGPGMMGQGYGQGFGMMGPGYGSGNGTMMGRGMMGGRRHCANRSLEKRICLSGARGNSPYERGS